MDGKIDGDPFWDAIPKSGPFRVLREKDKTASPETWFKMAYTNDALYIGVHCDEPKMDGVKTDSPDKPWENDSVELFLTPPSSVSYIHFIADAGGARYTGEGMAQTANPPWEVKCRKQPEAWSAELRIPWTTLLAAPEAGVCWTGNVGRNRQAGGKGEASSWAPLAAGFHDPAAFLPFFFPVKAECPEIRVVLAAKTAALKGVFQEAAAGLDSGSFAVRLLTAESETITPQGQKLESRMAPRLETEYGKLTTAAQKLKSNEREARLYNRLSEFFKNPSAAGQASRM
jgi:hypothetical protein